MLLNCGVGEDSSESLGLQGDSLEIFAPSEKYIYHGGRNCKSRFKVIIKDIAQQEVGEDIEKQFV